MGSWLRRKPFSYKMERVCFARSKQIHSSENSFRVFPAKSIFFLVWRTSDLKYQGRDTIRKRKEKHVYLESRQHYNIWLCDYPAEGFALG